MNKPSCFFVCIFCCCICCYLRGYAQSDYVLRGNWQLQSVLVDSTPGSLISSPAYTAPGWYSIEVPNSVLGALIGAKAYAFDPFQARNLEQMREPKLDKAWWFRKEFIIPTSDSATTILLRLQGINYTANVWVNGQKVADSTQIKGPYRIFELDLSRIIHKGKPNVLALEITRPFLPNKDGGDLAIDYADWIPDPPDFNAGILNEVQVRTCSGVGLAYPLVTTHFDLPSLDLAHLTVDARLSNYAGSAQDVVIKGTIDGAIHFEKKVRVSEALCSDITFDPNEESKLNIQHPVIWWPWQYGNPALHHLELSAWVGGKLASKVSVPFGIRETGSRLINDSSREFLINGKPILLRGAAWAPDLFQRRSALRQEQEIRLVRDMHMNIIRSEGKIEDEHFYELCDRYGILIMTGWMCCGAWQHPEHWDSAERVVAMSSDSSVMYMLRNKASVLVWLNGSDMPPTDTTVERNYLTIEQGLKWPNPIIATADGRVSKVSGYSGVKMLGPYEWVPPIYWETDATHQFGGAWSLATEISPGPSIPPYESLIKFIPIDSLNPSSGIWRYHTGKGKFGSTDVFNKALSARYGTYTSIRNFASKAQAQNYEAHRAMMEAYGLHKYQTATGVIQWMLSNPWPGLIWHTYDYFLYPGGTYFGMKKGLEPLHIQYSYATHSVGIINSGLRNHRLIAEATAYNLDGSSPFEHSAPVTIGPDSALTWLQLPEPGADYSQTWFLKLTLSDSAHKPISINWYWLSKKVDVLNWKRSNWYTTPESVYADYTALQELPKVGLEVSASPAPGTSGSPAPGSSGSPAPGTLTDTTVQQVRIRNLGKSVAFFVHLRVLRSSTGEDILPLIFSVNYICLAPGESRVITCKYAKSGWGPGPEGSKPIFQVSAWNLDIGGSKGDGKIKFEEGLPQ
jgi:exo-1,4-beta-D-glucosaminidase